MNRRSRWPAAVLSAVLAAVPTVAASAQAPGAPPPPAAPKLAAAWTAGNAAIAACLPEHVAVAIVDANGADKLIASGDGSLPRWVDFARRKAFTALTFGQPSMAVRDAARSDPALAQRLASDSRLIGFGGGLPIVRHGLPLGAIAVAGGSSQELDQRCAAAGLARIP